MVNEEQRKAEERDLHDRLRHHDHDHETDGRNKKWYAIDRANKALVMKRIRLHSAKGKRVLDYCCGNGVWSVHLAQRGYEVHGIDISPVSVGNAEAEAKKMGLDSATFRVMDAENMEFPDDFFDVILINGVLHHLDLSRAYAELARVLKPSGAVVATEALKHNKLIHWYRTRTPDLRSAWETDHILGKEEIEAAQEHFDSVEVLKFFHLATLAAVPARGTPVFKPLLSLLESIDDVVLKIPSLKWQAWMAVFELTKPKRRSSTNG